MCDLCGENVGCKFMHEPFQSCEYLTVEDWRSVYDFIKFVQLPFFHAVTLRAYERQGIEFKNGKMKKAKRTEKPEAE